MDQRKNTADWIAAYWEWIYPDNCMSERSRPARQAAEEASEGHNDRFEAPYFAWFEDEQRAWNVLKALRQSAAAKSEGEAAWRIDAEGDWSHALDGVLADMRALKGQVLALQNR